MIKQFSNIEKALLALVFVGGSLMLFIPLQKLIVLLLGLIVLVYLLMNPKISFYLMLFLSPWEQGFPLDYSSTPFSQTDILITTTFLGIIFRHLFTKKDSVNIRTKLDMWLIVFLIINFFAGITSVGHRGYQGFLRYGEIVTVFYMTVYFLRTKTIRLSELIKFILFTGLFQACFGILQSITGHFGADFQSERGYLGYLGIGSSLVWHGKGGFDHFNQLGPFLCIITLFFFPINKFLANKNKKRGYIALSILFFGLITTYSRGSLIGLIAGGMFFLYQTQKNKVKFLLTATPIGLILWGASTFLKNTSYVTTISPRNEMWEIAVASITQSAKSLLLGNGLKSYEDAAWQYIPANIPVSEYGNYSAHNFFIANAVEVGILGLGVILSFLLYLLVSTYKGFQKMHKITKYLNLSISLIIFSMFFEGMFDHAFNMFVLQLWLYLFLSILYAKTPIKTGRRVN